MWDSREQKAMGNVRSGMGVSYLGIVNSISIHQNLKKKINLRLMGKVWVYHLSYTFDVSFFCMLDLLNYLNYSNIQ